LSSVPSRGELYDWEQAHVLGRSDQDLAFYLELAERPGLSVLELGCGTGRLTIPVVESGADVVGLDIDPAMLGAARARHATVPLVCADMRAFAFGRAFDVVCAPYNCLQLLVDDTERQQCLESVVAVLAPGGVFAFEVRAIAQRRPRRCVRDAARWVAARPRAARHHLHPALRDH
jgi:SAM-dependent methyltransferase